MTARRINHGKHHRYEIDETRVPGITTVNNAIAKPALIDWAADKTADCALDRWDELTELPRSERDKILRRARWDHLKGAGERGTEVHRIVHRLALGDEVEFDDEIKPFVDAYLDGFVADWQPAELLVERPVFNRTARYAGTPDLVADLVDGRRWLLDFKTSLKGVFPETALQLAAARFAEFTLDPETGDELDLAEFFDWRTVQTAAVHLRADGYDVIPVDAGVDAFTVFLNALHIHRDYLEHRDRWVGEALEAPSQNGGDPT
jgi:hypothetical protein